MDDDTIATAPIAPTRNAGARGKLRGRYSCHLCGVRGHTSKRCIGGPKRLWRCLHPHCQSLVWEAERSIHSFDWHRRALRAEDLVQAFELVPFTGTEPTLEP